MAFTVGVEPEREPVSFGISTDFIVKINLNSAIISKAEAA
jgi:hypothetical protein